MVVSNRVRYSWDCSMSIYSPISEFLYWVTIDWLLLTPILVAVAVLRMILYSSPNITGVSAVAVKLK